jgi:hypothetical protein
VLAVAAVLLAGPAARAQDTCATAYEGAQELRRTHELSRARTELRLCERACPKKLAEDCSTWRREVEAELSSVLLDVRDADGQPLSRVHVILDGAPRIDVVPTEPVDLDPGPHTLIFEDDAGARTQVAVTLAVGERGHPIAVRFPRVIVPGPLPSPLPKPSPSLAAIHHSPAAYVLGGVGLAGLLAGGVLGIAGQVARANLVATGCAPRCDETSQVDPIARVWWGGAIAAIAGGVLLGTGVAVWVGEARSGKGGASLTAAPGPGWLGLVGRF